MRLIFIASQSTTIRIQSEVPIEFVSTFTVESNQVIIIESFNSQRSSVFIRSNPGRHLIVNGILLLENIIREKEKCLRFGQVSAEYHATYK